MQRTLVTCLMATLVLGGGSVAGLRAQEPAPQTYSLTEDPGFAIMGPSVIKLSRDGSKEVVEQIMPPGQGRDKEYHSRLFYDFQAHRLYTQILSDPASACGVQEYNDPAAPKEFDVISGTADLMKEMSGPNDKSTPAGTDTINGIPTRVVKVTSTDNDGKIWYAQKGGYIVRLDLISKDGKAQTIIAIKQISFAKPPASAFTLPASCASAQLPPPPIKPSTNVTALTLAKIGNYVGACPAHIKMVGTITVDGPGTVFYQFGAGTMEPGETITFNAAGTQTVTHLFTFQPKYGNNMGGSAILEAIGAEATGRHEMPTKASNNSDFDITCTSGGGK